MKDKRSILQKHITDGREVLLQNENSDTEVKVRVNPLPSETGQWIITINENDFYCREVKITTKTITTTQKVYEGLGNILFFGTLAKRILFHNNCALIE